MLLRPQAIALPSLRAVARACNVSPAAVYLHFDSQLALIQAVVDAQIASLGAATSAAVEGSATPVAAFAEAYAVWGLEHPGAYQLLFESAERTGIPNHQPGDEGEAIIQAAVELIEPHRPGEAARHTALTLWMALHGIVSLRLHKPDLDWGVDLKDQVAEVTTALLGPRV